MEYAREKSDIFEVIVTAIRESSSAFIEPALGIDLDGKTCFVDLGINSIDYAEIMAIVMERLDIDMPLEEFVNTNNILEVVNIFIDKLYSR